MEKRKHRKKYIHRKHSTVEDNSLYRKRQKRKRKRELVKHTGSIHTKRITERTPRHFTYKEREKVPIPDDFSIINNNVETIECFETIKRKMKLNISRSIFLDFANVENLTIDAIMYLIAFMKNRYKQGNVKPIGGDYPKDKVAESILINSGFLEYVRHNISVGDVEQLKNDNTIMITVGNKVTPSILAEVCKLVQRAFNIERTDTMFIYTIIGELMANTVEHAFYDSRESKKVVNSWYLYVKLEDNKVKFTILDTGLGIPATIHKRATEKIKDLIPTARDECNYILEALQGMHKNIAKISRSRTKAENRNKGLPAIYKCHKEGKIKNLKILSNLGMYSSTESIDSLDEQRRRVQGTLFYWEIESSINEKKGA